MVKLNEVEKSLIHNTEPTWASTIIYYIEQRCKACKEGMSLPELIEEAKLMWEEQWFYAEDFEGGDQ